MTIRKATADDRDAFHELVEAFNAELPPPPHYQETWEEEWEQVRGYLERHVALVAEADGSVVGYALAKPKRGRVGYLSDVYVHPDFRRRGIGRALIAAAAAALAEDGADLLTLNVDVGNEAARTVYRRLGFRDESLDLIVEIDKLQANAPRAPSFGSVHVQTDDEGAVARSVAGFLRRDGAKVAAPRNGWVVVHDDGCDTDGELQRRLAKELSYRLGVVVVLRLEEGQVVRMLVLDQGHVIDEYLSVPEFFGPLPPGDAIALGANPTAIARLTGADPARVRAVARTADTPAELPPAPELLAALAGALGIEEAEPG